MTKLTNVKAIAFSSLMAGLTILLTVLSTFIVGTSLLAMIVLPLIASLVSLKVEFKYRFIYFFACLITFFFDPSLTLFIVIPSLISGIVLGSLISKYIQSYYIVFLTTLVVSLLQIGSTYLIDFIYQISMIELFSSVLKIDLYDFNNLFYFFIFTISLTQVCLSYTIISNELKKLNIDFNDKKNQFTNIYIINIISFVATIISYFTYKPIYFLLLGFSIYFGVILAYYIFSYYQKKMMAIIQIPLYFICLFAYLILYSKLGENSLILLPLPILSQIITSSYIIILHKIIKKGQINESLFDNLN